GYPEGDLQKLTPAQQKSLDEFARYTEKGIEPVHSDEAYEEWLRRPISEQGEANLLAEYRASFDDAHFAAAQARQSSIRDGKTDKVNQYVGDVRRIEGVLRGTPGFELKPSGKDKDRKKKAREERIVGGILRRFEEVSAEKGSALTPPEKDEIIIKELGRRMWVDTIGWGGTEFISAGMSPEEREDAYVPFDQITETMRSKIKNIAASENMSASESDVEFAAGQILLRGKGLSNAQEALIIIESLQR
ncbi:hypothetical protein LCGC14_2054470, partial [marine sediment metagenome]